MARFSEAAWNDGLDDRIDELISADRDSSRSLPKIENIYKYINKYDDEDGMLLISKGYEIWLLGLLGVRQRRHELVSVERKGQDSCTL